MARVLLEMNAKIEKRLRFEDDEGYATLNGTPKGTLSKRTRHLDVKAIAALFIASAVASWMMFHYVNGHFGGMAEEKQFGDKLKPGNQTSEGSKFYKFLAAVAFGGGTTLHTWMLTYMDSKQPGVDPPTPSPRNCRRGRYFEFHLAYVMAVANGIMFFCLYMWR